MLYRILNIQLSVGNTVTHTHTHTHTHTYLPMVVYADQGRNQRYGDQPKYTCYRNSLMSACTLGSGLLKSIFISGPARN